MKKLLINFFAGFLFFVPVGAVDYEINPDPAKLTEFALEIAEAIKKIPSSSQNKQKRKSEAIIKSSTFFRSLEKMTPKDLFKFIEFVINEPSSPTIIDILVVCVRTFIDQNTWQFLEVLALLEELCDLYFDVLPTKKTMDPESVLTFIRKVLGNDFRGNVARLVLDLKRLPVKIKKRKRIILSERIISRSEFYTLLKMASGDPKIYSSLLFFVENLNEVIIQPPNNETIFSILFSSFIQLVEEKAWRPEQVAAFVEDLYLWHSQKYEAATTTPVSHFIDKMRMTAYCSPESREFMDAITYFRQFDPIASLIKDKNEDIALEKTQKKIIEIAKGFFNQAAQMSYKFMSKEAYDNIFIRWTKLAKGMKQFQKNSIHDKNSFLSILEESHLLLFEIAPKESQINDEQNLIRIIKQNVKILDEKYVVVVALVKNEEKAIIKSITLSKDADREENKNLYIFVEELVTENPRQQPNTQIPLAMRSLYKFQHLPQNKIALVEAQKEERLAIIKAIKIIENTEYKNSESEIECLLYTAIRHGAILRKITADEDELMLVEILRQNGIMMSRALFKTITSYIDQYPRPWWGPLSDKNDFQIFKSQLNNVLLAVYVMVTNEFISQWHHQGIMEPITLPSFAVNPIMTNLKEAMIAALNGSDIWILRSAMECSYDKTLLKTKNEN